MSSDEGRRRGSPRRHLHRGVHGAERLYDSVRHRLRPRAESSTPAVIVPYLGYGDGDTVWLSGRVLEHVPEPPGEDDRWWRNLVATLRRIESDEVPGVRIEARAGRERFATETDDEGYFHLAVPMPVSVSRHCTWHELRLEAPGWRDPTGQPSAAAARFVVPGSEAEVVIVSDIDDTVLETDAVDLLRMARRTVFENARSRAPEAGVAAFYRALVEGVGGEADLPRNPIFYVSSSPWNLYDVLRDFLQLRGIPLGPLLLQDWGIDEAMLGFAGHGHKLERLEELVAAYPGLKFVMLGDSGQRDPELYLEVVARWPERIRGILIRDASGPERDEAVAALAVTSRAEGIAMYLVSDSIAAAECAAELEIIRPGRVAEIAQETRSELRRELRRSLRDTALLDDEPPRPAAGREDERPPR